MPDIRETVLRIVADVSGRDVSQITNTQRLVEDLRIKSADRIELTIRVEDEIGVEISIFEILKAKTVADVIELSRTKQPANG